MRRTATWSPVARVLVWLASVALFGCIGLVLVGTVYPEFADCSNPEIHQSANTTFGWAVAIVTAALPVAVAVWLAGGLWRRLPAVALAVALVTLVLWQWILDADCEWYALSQL